ncbi:serine/threonine-protein phosphatase BSL1 [Pyrus x bretschneideri]|uniref:serine/threonine-protein phosphatase BSL1 n=1 Tax=Pyrus x bretschneideri TaxID=225117 RepID=UPI0020309AE1|nr:serine/threonine-protein phosphatase BSL1 [Pyrus x bretschneideri]
MGSKPWLFPAPTYRTLETFWDCDDDAPGPRCAHTLTAVAATKTHGPRLILFGGATAIEGGGPSSAPGIRLAGVTNSVHSYDILTRKWTRMRPAGEPPSPRAAHAAAAVGTMVVFQGGIGPAGHSTDDLYVLDLTNDKFKWHRVVVQGQGPGPRYGHVMDLVAQRYLVTVSGNDGKRVLSDAWALDTAQKPYAWARLNPEGDRPSARMYATASARSDGMFLLCGGRDISGTPLADAYGLLMHRNGQWEWTLAPGVSPSPRYEHAAVFVGARLHVTGGALRGGRGIEGEAAIAVLDTAAGVWLDRNGLVTSSRTGKGQNDHDPSLELMRRFRHAAASLGFRIYIYGGLKGDILLDDFLVAENSSVQSEGNLPVLTSERSPTVSSPRMFHANTSTFGTSSDGEPESTSSTGLSMDKNSMEKLREASAAEAEAASAVWQAAQSASATPSEETSVSDDNSQVAETLSDGSDTEADVRLHHRAVVVAKEAVGNLGGMVRQLSLDQFENESRRTIPMNNDLSHPNKKYTRQKSPQGLHKKVISTLLRPRNWKPPVNRKFFLDSYEVGELCYAAEQIFMQEQTVLQLKAPVKVFGDLHGQFGDLMRLFDEYGFPSAAGDITYIDDLFLGDYVDRGQHSLETITLLLALKIEYPDNVHLIRGNHEAADINALFGFRIECVERMGENDGIWAWTRFNQLFNYLPLAALIEKKIICMHGGIGRSINSVEQIEKLERPITMDAGSIILMDLLWSDPTENDSVEGLRPNARGPGLVTFGPDRVTEFCKRNKLQLIVRAHECVMDGFERFAQGQLITLFSATNYCGTANNAGAILVVGRGLVVVPKLIHPLPPPLQSPETSPERVIDDAWMQELNIQRPPTPTRGRPQPDLDRNSLAYI